MRKVSYTAQAYNKINNALLGVEDQPKLDPWLKDVLHTPTACEINDRFQSRVEGAYKPIAEAIKARKEEERAAKRKEKQNGV